MKTSNRNILAVLATGITIVFATSAKANLVANGGFENGDFTGWTLGGNTGFTGVSGNFDGVAPNSGSYQAYFGAVGSTGYITQTISTTPGGSYSLDFWIANFGGTPSYVNALWNDVQVISTPILPLVNSSSFPYTEYTSTVTATTTTSSIELVFQQNPSYFLLDDVSVTPVPEASSCLAGALLLIPLGMSALRILRKSQTA